jgi:glycosyltransferase involved in cell wall biosynthesis
MTDVLYVANARVPSRKAHVYQILQMCDAFVEVGNDVELVVPRRRQPTSAPDSVYYDVTMAFNTTRLPCLDLLWLSVPLAAFARAAFYLQTGTFTLASLLYVTLRDPDIVYTRSRSFAVLGSFLFGKSVVVEVHRRPSHNLITKITGVSYDRSRGLVLISEGLENEWQSVTRAPTHVAPDGVDLELFEVQCSKEELRAALELPPGPLVCYAGSIQPWKGVDTLVEGAHELEDATVCVVGGTDEQREWLRSTTTLPENLLLVGQVPPDRVPEHLAASDVLVVPNTAKCEISERYTSPLKLFEYMAAERPIVASDLPSLREIIDEDTAYFATPDDSVSLAETIERALTDPDASHRARAARERVAEYTWRARARKISDKFFEERAGGRV